MNRQKLSSLILSLFIIAAFGTTAWGGGSITVEKIVGCSQISTIPTCSIQAAITDPAQYDTIYVKPVADTFGALAYYSPIAVTVTRAITLVGLTSSGQPAWTDGTAGASSTAPKIMYNGSDLPHYRNLALIAKDNTQIVGFNFIGQAQSAITCTAIGTSVTPTVNYVTLSYCSFDMGTSELNAVDKGVAVDYGSTGSNLSISYCKFTGQTTNTSQWFFVGDNGDGGSVNNVGIEDSEITNTMSSLQLNNSIKNIYFSNNTFSNSWDITDADSRLSETYGYILVEEPSDDALNIIQGITLTHNTFNNSTGTAPKEFGFVIDNNVEESDAGNDWETNFALHFNNFLQDDTGNPFYPVIGFVSSTYFTTDITATGNWWGATTGPRDYESDSGSASIADLSNHAGYHPWSRAKVSGGTLYDLDATTAVQTITGTQILNSHMSLKIKTEGTAATLIPTRYTGNPTGTSLSSAISYYSLGLQSGTENIGAITATFYSPSGSTLDSSNPLYWYNGSSWVKFASYAITTTSARNILSRSISFPTATYYITHTFGPAVTAYITDTAVSYVTPTSISYITSTTMNSRVTQTFFALVGTGGSGSSTTTTTSGSSSTTSTKSSSSNSSSTSSSTTTSVTGTSTTSSSTTTSTDSSGSTTTSTAGDPILNVSPATLDFMDNETALKVAISNTGTGTLTWNVSDNETEYDKGSGWIFSVVPKAGSVEDSPESVTVTVNRKGLEPDSYSARLPVTSNAGTLDLDVSMEVSRTETPAIRISSQVMMFLNRAATERTFNITNTSTGTLTWEIEAPVYHKGKDWITVSPSSGYTTETATVTVAVNKESVGTGLYSATLPIKSNGGNKTITVIMLVDEGPVLNVNPSLLLFLNKDVDEGKIIITNGESGTLTWEVGTIDYTNGDGWITSISPEAGETTTEDDDIFVNITREGLNSGIYMAKIPITSNGGKRNVTVFMLVPFL